MRKNPPKNIKPKAKKQVSKNGKSKAVKVDSAALPKKAKMWIVIMLWIIAMLLFAIISGMIYFRSEDSLPSIEQLENPRSDEASVVYSSDGEILGSFYIANRTKVDFNELNALITAVQQTTGRGGAVIGNALKTIFTRLQRESTLEALERFNVTVRDVQGNILPATQVLDNFAGKYDKLADSTQAYLREQVAGVFQANILSAILKDLNKEQSTFSRALDVSVNATENAAQANEKLNQTMSALLQNTATEFAKLQKNLGDAAFLDLGKGIVGALRTALKSLNRFDEEKQCFKYLRIIKSLN